MDMSQFDIQYPVSSVSDMKKPQVLVLFIALFISYISFQVDFTEGKFLVASLQKGQNKHFDSNITTILGEGNLCGSKECVFTEDP